MFQSPILIVAFNRPSKLRQLLQSLRSSAPPIVMLAVDGPRANHPNDVELVTSTQSMISEITWPCQIHTRFRDTNLGLQTAYVDAVDWAMSTYGHSIVIEDDVIAGPELYEFLNSSLYRYREDNKIGQINGYNFVPSTQLSQSLNRQRLTKYPTSYCWASWHRAWHLRDMSIQWGKSQSLTRLAQHTGDRIAAAMWRINFSNAISGRVDTWDYAWVSTLWENNLQIVSPNRNLCLYDGFDSGTHTRRKRSPVQLAIESLESLRDEVPGEIDSRADNWQRKHIYKEHVIGLSEKMIATCLLQILKMAK